MEDFIFSLPNGPGLVDYDIETYPNVFTMRVKHKDTGQRWKFEISDRRHDHQLIKLFAQYLITYSYKMRGFNNLHFDYCVLHMILQLPVINATVIYEKAMSIINAPHHARFAQTIWERDHKVPQIDLFKVHHFDNASKMTSLKVLEFNMRMKRIEDLPFELGKPLTPDQIDVLGEYNDYDVDATARFGELSEPAIKLRENLEATLGENVINCSDVKIGEKLLVKEMEANGIQCYEWVDGKRKKRQTKRESINLGSVIFPYVTFERQEFNQITEWLRQKTITETKNVFGPIEVDLSLVRYMDSTLIKVRGLSTDEFPELDELKLVNGIASLHIINKHLGYEFHRIADRNPNLVFISGNDKKSGLNCIIDGLKYQFGTGGLHASVDAQIVRSDSEYQIVDVDVKSFYPNLGIKNKLFPAHLGQQFCDAYESVYRTRISFPKKTPENEAYKLALNGAYGGSNNQHSPLLDPQYTMSITINGQLLLCVLAEHLLKTPGLKMIQCNTDGVTYLCPRQYLEHTRAVCRWWEQLTQLELEEALYSRMFIRDVNNYIAEFEDGSVKRIGAYSHTTALENPGTRELPWHKDWSFRIVPIAAEAYLLRGIDIRSFIENHEDVYDFFGRTKVPKSMSLELDGVKVANIIRYYISNEGGRLEKVMPAAGPEGQYKKANGVSHYEYDEWHRVWGNTWTEDYHTKNKSRYEIRRDGFHPGHNVSILNVLPDNYQEDDSLRDNIDIDWYVKEVEKLVKPLERKEP